MLPAFPQESSCQIVQPTFDSASDWLAIAVRSGRRIQAAIETCGRKPRIADPPSDRLGEVRLHSWSADRRCRTGHAAIGGRSRRRRRPLAAAGATRRGLFAGRVHDAATVFASATPPTAARQAPPAACCETTIGRDRTVPTPFAGSLAVAGQPRRLGRLGHETLRYQQLRNRLVRSG